MLRLGRWQAGARKTVQVGPGAGPDSHVTGWPDSGEEPRLPPLEASVRPPPHKIASRSMIHACICILNKTRELVGAQPHSI